MDVGETMMGGAEAQSKTHDGPDAADVFKYWLAMVRQEEALGGVLRASLTPDKAAPDLKNPTSGQPYIKLMADGLSELHGDLSQRRVSLSRYLLQQEPTLSFPLTGERVAFLEHALVHAYRRERAARFGRESGEIPIYLVGFPTIHVRRKNTLATILRFPIEPPAWLGDAGGAWTAPNYGARQRAPSLDGPTMVRLGPSLDASSDEGSILPYILDTHQLSHTFGVLDENVQQLIDLLVETPALTPATMILAVTALLTSEGSAWPEDAIVAALEADAADLMPEALIAGLAAAAESRLGAGQGVRIYPIALAWDGSLLMATRSLQQDLEALIELPPRPIEHTPLAAYIYGQRRPAVVGTHAGLRSAHPLTADQRAVADQVAESPFTVASGPPGTGKTELILNLAAHALIECVTRLSEGWPVGAPMVVMSTNNRAVDNVLDPLTRDLPDSRLPLGLRVGSMSVMAEVTLPTLRRVLGWFDNQRLTEAAALARWKELGTELIAARNEWFGKRTRKRLATEAPEALPIILGRLKTLSIASDLVKSPEARAEFEKQAVIFELSSECQRLSEAVTKIAGGLEPTASTRAQRLWRKYDTGPLEGLVKRLKSEGLPWPVLKGPLDTPKHADAFFGLAAALTKAVAALQSRIEHPLSLPDGISSPAELDAELMRLTEEFTAMEEAAAEFGTTVDLSPSPADLAAEHALYRLALEAREAFALANRELVVAALRTLATTLSESPHLFKVHLVEKELDRVLFSLFPVLGSTLLSVGNTFALEPDVIGLAVIDEAGQCHPAYAISALARAERALIIGDVNQLEPVIGLDDSEEARLLKRLGFAGALGLPSARHRLAPYRATATAARSAQTLAGHSASEVLVLHDHFRCQAPIIAISDALCAYGLRVRTPLASLGDRTRHLRGPLVLHDIRGEQRPSAGSWSNEAEVERVGLFVKALLREGLGAGQIAVLTPYRGQLAALRARLRADGVTLEEDLAEMDAQQSLFDTGATTGLALGTVHRFQGGERDVVIFSTVITEARSLGFLNERVNLVNVAVSRAKKHLVVVGHADVLARGRITRQLLDAIPIELRIPHAPQ